MLTTGAEISANEAMTMGLVNRVFDDEKFDSAVADFVHQFQKLSRSALALSKRLFYRTDAVAFEEALQAGVDANATARMSTDCREGIARFLKK
jgi:enoyl-CoA hydratase/carnithine racemase